MNLTVMKIFLILFGIMFLASCTDQAAVSQAGGWLHRPQAQAVKKHQNKL